jgi:hypothetical protein
MHVSLQSRLDWKTLHKFYSTSWTDFSASKQSVRWIELAGHKEMQVCLPVVCVWDSKGAVSSPIEIYDAYSGKLQHSFVYVLPLLSQ